MNKQKLSDDPVHNYVVLVHEYSYKQGGKYITPIELYKFLESNGLDVSNTEVRSNIEHVISDSFYIGGSAGGDSRILIPKSETIFRYIDYLELKEAQKSSRSANRNAILALSLTSLLAAVQILVGVFQIIDSH